MRDPIDHIGVERGRIRQAVEFGLVERGSLKYVLVISLAQEPIVLELVVFKLKVALQDLAALRLVGNSLVYKEHL